MHTPDKWTLRRIYSNGCEVCPRVESPDRWIADVVGSPHLGFTDTIGIGERIVADHNALAGIDDPAAFVAAVRELRDAYFAEEATLFQVRIDSAIESLCALLPPETAS